jgi:hypothetical protein
MSTPSYYATCTTDPPKGIKPVQVYGSFSAARERAKELARINLVAAVYECNKAGAAKSAEPLFVARPERSKPTEAKTNKPSKPKDASK